MSNVTCHLIKRCRGCSAESTEWPILLAMEPMPLAGNFQGTLEEATQSPLYPLTWVQCDACALVQVLEDIPDDELFRTYHYASSTVPGLVDHFQEHAAELSSNIQGKRASVLEIGCNDGVLLRRLPSSWRRVGVDPSDIAKEQAPTEYELINRPFTLDLARDLQHEETFDLVVSSNTLAHLSNLRDIFEGIELLLAPDGRFVIEVHDLDATLRQGQWDTIYHEHKVEWSVRSLSICLANVGLHIVNVERKRLHGGLLRVTAQRSTRSGTLPTDWNEAAEAASLKLLRRLYEGRRDTRLYSRLLNIIECGESLCGFGAAGRATVWLNQLRELRFDFVADDSTRRQGTWIPGVGVPVVEPGWIHQRSTQGCLITAWNYATDIRAKHPDYRGTWFQAFTA